MAAIWLFLFVLWELLNKDAERSRWQTIFYGLLYSLSIGMISWGFTHFLDSPERSLWILPAGYFVSRLVFAAKNKWENFNRLSILWGLFTTAALFWLARAAILYLPASFYSELADHHSENATWTTTGINAIIDHSMHDMDTSRLSSWTAKTTFEFMFDGMGNLSAGKEWIIQFHPNALVGWDAIQTINDLELVHEKYIHLILVRKDGWDFLHLHPSKDSMGRRATPVNFPSWWEWYIYADMKSKEFGSLVITNKLTVEWPTSSFVINPITNTGTLISQSGIDFTISWDAPSIMAATNFYISANSGTLENYLGAKWHMVAINLTDMWYSHVHPNENRPQDSFINTSWPNWTSFMAHFENAGIYRIFIQVQIAGEIYTLPLSVEVKEGISWSDTIGEHNH